MVASSQLFIAMATRNSKTMIILAVLGATAGLLIWATHYQSDSTVPQPIADQDNSTTLPDSSSEDDADPVDSDSSTEVPTADPVVGLIQAVDKTISSRFSPWVTDTYLNRAVGDRYVRHNIVQINSFDLAEQIEGIVEPAEYSTGVTHPNSQLTLDLFDDVTYDVKFTDFNRYKNALAAGGYALSPDGFRSEANIYIDPNGTIKGSISTKQFDYRIVPTPELPYYLVVEMTSGESTDAVRH